MKLDGYSFSGDKTVSFNSNAVVSIGLYNASANPKAVTIDVLDELGTLKATLYYATLEGFKGYNTKIFVKNGHKLKVSAAAGIGVNVGVINESYVAKGVLTTEYIACVGDGVKDEFSLNGMSVNSFKELCIIFDGVYTAVFGKDYTLSDDGSVVKFNEVVANELEFVMIVTKQE